MGFVASFFSGLKTEVEWLITSLAVAPATNEAAQDGTPANVAAAHHDNSAPDPHSTVLAIADYQSDSTTTTESTPAQHAGADDAPASGVQDIAFTLPHADNLPIAADFTLGQTPSAPLTPLSFTDNFSQPDALNANPADSGSHQLHDLNLYAAPAADHGDSHWSLPDSGQGDFALASLVPQLGPDFAKGGGGSQHGGGGGGAPYLIYDTKAAGITGPSGSPSLLDITLSFDSSAASAPKTDQNGSSAYGFVQDFKAVANFLAANFANTNAHITVDIGYGEIAGSHVSSSVLGESETYYLQVPKASGQTQYQALQAAYAAHDPAVTLPADTFPASQALEVTPAEGKALGLNLSYPSVDGWIGFGAGSNLFFYNPGSAVSGEYDFMGTAAHELTEVMGRETWNGAKSGGLLQFMPLDLFHYADSNDAQIYSGTTAGHFALNGTTYEEFNTSSAGDYSDWANPHPYPYTTDAFDWSGGASVDSPVSYADYLVMEAVGYAGSASNFQPLP